MPKNSPVELGTMQGTLWSGTIDSALAKGWLVKDIDYSISFLPLLIGTVGGDIDIAKGDVKGKLGFAIEDENNLSIEQADLRFSAQKMESLLPFPGIELQGLLSTKELELELSNKKIVHLVGASSWNNASVTVQNNSIDLGNFSIDWTTDEVDKSIIGKINKTKNILGLEGTINLSPSGLLDFKGSISTETDKSIYSAFLLFANGKPSQGRLPIKFKKKIQ